MQYVNIPISVLRSVEYIGSGPVERATFVSLLGWCAEHETGGRIEKAAEWKDRRWQQLCGVTEQEVRIQCDLWKWDGDDVVIFWYPHEQEDQVRSFRTMGAVKSPKKSVSSRLNGTKGGRPKKGQKNQTKNLTENPPRSVSDTQKITQEKPIAKTYENLTRKPISENKPNQNPTIGMSWL